jgi:hypothetical protein
MKSLARGNKKYEASKKFLSREVIIIYQEYI